MLTVARRVPGAMFMKLVQTDLKNFQEHDEIKIQLHPVKKNILEYSEKWKERGEVIGKIISGFCFVKSSWQIKDLVEALNEKPEISEIGVVDEEGKPLGLIVRKQLFDQIGTRFGREILENKKISDLIQNEMIRLINQPQIFENNRNILSVVEEIKEKLEKKEIEPFIAIDSQGVFAGIFTNLDILFYLSKILESDMKIAKNLQDSIVEDKKIMNEPSFRLLAGSKMAKDIGGDFYFIKKYSDNQWIFSLCDVSGKGVSAALVTTLLGGVFSIYDFHSGISLFLKKLNEYIFQSFQVEKYLTGIFMRFDEKTGKMSFYDMGHGHAYILRNHKLHKIKSTHANFPIGIMPEIENPAASTISLKKDDILLIFTDGIPEQCNEANEEYGVARVEKIVKENIDTNFEHISDLVLKDLKIFRGKEYQQDDITFLFFHYKG
ncbi:MAG TPA: hypothetical protein DHW82_05530 [Spirochaetia bacterium]|nr:MAG: hypothetical protein A2Y41_07485 [Spirochaetes bacterium GWB1_36_13]HCL56454.1 hypothetical protein [Spirochaetia bacterium]